MMQKWQAVYADQLGLVDSGLTTSMWQAPGLDAPSPRLSSDPGRNPDALRLSGLRRRNADFPSPRERGSGRAVL
jgi:hypothetical protein